MWRLTRAKNSNNIWPGQVLHLPSFNKTNNSKIFSSKNTSIRIISWWFTLFKPWIQPSRSSLQKSSSKLQAPSPWSTTTRTGRIDKDVAHLVSMSAKVYRNTREAQRVKIPSKVPQTVTASRNTIRRLSKHLRYSQAKRLNLWCSRRKTEGNLKAGSKSRW